MPTLGIPEITKNDLGADTLATKINTALRLLADQLVRVMGQAGPFSHGKGAVEFQGNVLAREGVGIMKRLNLYGETDRDGNVKPIRFVHDLPVYANNTAALAGGLAYGELYRTATGSVLVVYEV